MDDTTGSGEAMGDDGASSRRVMNGDDAANHCAARRGATESGITRQRRRGRAWPGHASQGTDDGELLRSKARCGLAARVAALAPAPSELAGRGRDAGVGKREGGVWDGERRMGQF